MRIKEYNNQSVQQNKKSALDRIKNEAKVKDSTRLKNLKESSDLSSASISGKAKEMAKAKQLAISAREVREDKIAELKRRIANKEYNIKSDEIAGKMVEEHLRTRDIG